MFVFLPQEQLFVTLDLLCTSADIGPLMSAWCSAFGGGVKFGYLSEDSYQVQATHKVVTVTILSFQRMCEYIEFSRHLQNVLNARLIL